MTPPELAAVLKDAVLAGVGVASVTVAALGLSTWNRQLRGQAEFDVARALARATYSLRQELWICRVPLVRAREFPEGYVGAIRNDPLKEAEAWAYVYDQRWQPLSAAWQQFDSCTLEAEAVWGSAVRATTDKLRQCLGELRAAMESSVDNARSEGRTFRDDPDFGKTIRQVLHGTPTKAGNSFTERIDGAINAIEAMARPHLRRQ
jgi:hypothetical protein